MPTYVYKFVDTGETFEVQQAFTEEALTEVEHPDTGVVMPVKKVFTPVGVTFKGDGFYKTDSRSTSKRSSTAGDSASAKSDAGSTKKDSASKGSADSSTSGSSSGQSSTPSSTATA